MTPKPGIACDTQPVDGHSRHAGMSMSRSKQSGSMKNQSWLPFGGIHVLRGCRRLDSQIPSEQSEFSRPRVPALPGELRAVSRPAASGPRLAGKYPMPAPPGVWLRVRARRAAGLPGLAWLRSPSMKALSSKRNKQTKPDQQVELSPQRRRGNKLIRMRHETGERP